MKKDYLELQMGSNSLSLSQSWRFACCRCDKVLDLALNSILQMPLHFLYESEMKTRMMSKMMSMLTLMTTMKRLREKMSAVGQHGSERLVFGHQEEQEEI